jgi:hypothetical protein
MVTENPLLEAALDYARRGWPVFPLFEPIVDGCSCGAPGCSSAGKHPRTRRGLKDATTDQATIQKWWNDWPSAGIGIPTGKPAGFIVLDIDPEHGGEASLLDLVRKHGSLPDTVQVLTGGGGEHYFFKRPSGGARNRTGVFDGIDVRGDGGYVVAPPSLHATGNRHEWEVSSHPGDIPFAELPDWLGDVIGGSAPSRNGSNPNSRQGSEPIQAGKRNQTLASLAGTMRRRGMTGEAIQAALRAENESRCCPPLSSSEVDTIAASIARYDPDYIASKPTATHRVVVNGRQDREILEKSRDALWTAFPDLVYRRSGRLMRIVGPVLDPISAGGLYDRLARAVSWIRVTDGGDKAASVPRRLIPPLLEAPGVPIPTVEEVVTIPAFVGPDFMWVNSPGFDAGTGTLFVGSHLDVAEVADVPSAEDIQAARKTIDGWLIEFPFADRTARAHAIALLITLVVRPAVTGHTPMFVIEASTPGTGKTTLAEVVCLAATGVAPISKRYSRDGEEMAKRAASWVECAYSAVLLDDVARITGDSANVLSSLITTGGIEVRAMRELRMAGGRWSGILIATGNNIALAEEMPRKICRVRLDSPEDPTTRQFRRTDIHAWTLEHRAEILRSVVTLVSAWKAIGRPHGPNTRPSFNEWAGVVGGILSCLNAQLSAAFLDHGDLADMMTFGEGVDELRAFVQAWIADGRGVNDGGIPATDLVGVAEGADVFGAVMGDKSDRSKASRLGRHMKRQRGKTVLGHRITGVQDRRSKALRWSLLSVSDEMGGDHVA